MSISFKTLGAGVMQAIVSSSTDTILIRKAGKSWTLTIQSETDGPVQHTETHPTQVLCCQAASRRYKEGAFADADASNSHSNPETTMPKPSKNIKSVRTTDLLHGWFASELSDGSMTIRNPDKGQRIDIPLDSVEILRSIFTNAA